MESGMVYGPRIYNGYYSYVHKNGGKSALDWIVTKGIAKVINIYEDKEQSPYATYDWSFVSEVNGYGRKTKSDYLNIFGVPDHAILKGMIEL